MMNMMHVCLMFFCVNRQTLYAEPPAVIQSGFGALSTVTACPERL